MVVVLKLVACPLSAWALATLVFPVPPLWARVAALRYV
jgi:hypothetical protein